jgi:hypothetical protein
MLLSLEMVSYLYHERQDIVAVRLSREELRRISRKYLNPGFIEE